jgi:hypothetical protein
MFESRANLERSRQLFGKYLSRKRIYGKWTSDILSADLPTRLQETNMDPILLNQLARIKVQEMLQEAAEARSDRKAQLTIPITRKLRFALAAIPVVLWIVWGFLAG